MEEKNTTTVPSSFYSQGRGKFRPTTKSYPCQICSRFGDCSISSDGAIACCRKIEQGAFRIGPDKKGRLRYLHRLDGVDRPTPLPPMPAAGPEVERADDDTLHDVYAALLAALELSLPHRENLRQRGLTDDEIDQRGYRTQTQIKGGRSRLARALRDRFGDKLLRVPGFFVKQGDRSQYLTIAGHAGLLIPVRDLTGRIVALRIRRDEGNPKYTWLSTGNRGGAGSGARVHVSKSIAAQTKIVRVTEGELKADIATARSGILTLSLPGVGNWRGVIELLRSMSCEIVRLAIDMDARENPHVARALDEIAFGLVEAGFTLELETWDPKCKGIDDALVSGTAIEIVPSAEARAAIGKIVQAGAGDGAPPKISRGDAFEGDEDDRNEIYLPEWKPFPVDALPETIRAFACEYARALEADPSILALFALATVAGCIGRARVIRITPTWWEPCAIFGCVIGVSCSKKSAALREAIAPAELFDQELHNKSTEAFLAYDEAMERYAAFKNEKNGMERPPRPVEPRDEQLIAQDITIEDVIKRFAINGRGMMFPFEELRMFFESMGRYKSGGGGYEESIWLNIFDGINFHFSRSKHRQRLRTRVLASVFGGTQPSAWAEIASKMAFGTGFMGRFLPIWPDKVTQTGVYMAPNMAVTKAYHELVRSAAMVDRDDSCLPGWVPVEMIFTGSAQQLWQDWEKKWGDRIDSSEGEIHTLLARMKTYCARFALIASVCDSLAGFDGHNFGPNIVEKDHLRNAITMCEWFAEEAERIYFRGRMNPQETQREDVLQKMRDRHSPKVPRNQWYSLTPRELWASNRGKWKNSTAAAAFLETLCQGTDGIGRLNGTPGPVIRVHRRYFLRDKK